MKRISLFTALALICAALAACDQSGSDTQGAAAQAPRSEPQATEKQAAAPAQPTPQTAELGKPAPDFTLTDLDGKTHQLSTLRGKTVVLEWFNPDCPFVRHAHGKGVLADMAKRVAGSELVWLSINSNAPGKQGQGLPRNQRAREEYKMVNPVLLDESGTVGRAYGAQKTPHMYVIDARGVLVYRGGIDNAPMGEVDATRPRPQGAPEGQHVNYVDAALEDLKAGRAVRLPDTPAYGCTVKYAS